MGNTILNVEISPEQVDYTLFYLTMEDCMFQPRSTIKAIPLRGWADQPDHPHPIPNLPEDASLEEWLDWADRHCRGVRASAMEWVLMDSSQGRMFTENLCSSPLFRSKFGELYTTLTNALAWLGVKELPNPELYSGEDH